MNKLSTLFLAFLKIGALTFGGGYAMISIIQKEAVEKYHWIDEEEILDIVAISESTPGPLAVNMATFVGYKVGGAAGSIFATLGVVLPSFCIILIISLFYNAFRSNVWVSYAFSGIKAGVVLLLINGFLKLAKPIKWDILNISIAVLTFALVAFFNIKSILIILLAIIVGIISNILINTRKRGNDQ